MVARRTSGAVEPSSREVQSLRGEMARVGVRYTSLVETLPRAAKRDPLDGVWCVSRIDGASRVTRRNVYRLVAFSPRHQSRTLTLLSTDTGVAANFDVARAGADGLGAIVAVGGGSDAHEPGRGFSARADAKGRNLTLAPVELFPAESAWQRVLDGAWLAHDARWRRLMPTWGARPPGCVDAHAAPSCNFVRAPPRALSLIHI